MISASGDPTATGRKEGRYSELNLRRKRGQQRGCYYQLMLKNIFISSYRMKNALFKNRDEILDHDSLKKLADKILYKLDRRALSIQQVYIKENISTKQRGRVLVDTFHLPYAYKYDNFCEFLYYEENHVKFKQAGMRAEVQPFKLKLRQDVLQFTMNFFNQSTGTSSASETTEAMEPNLHSDFYPDDQASFENY